MEKFTNIIGFILLITSIFVFGLKGMSVEMGIAVAASSIFLAFANLPKFSKFKGAGFEAELKQVVDEANATIENLKEVAKPLIQTNLVALTNAGRFSEGAFNKSHDLYDQLSELQKKIGLKSDDLEISKSEYLNIHAWDMISELSSNIERSGIEKFSITTRDTLNICNFEKAPDIKKFHELLSNLKLNKENTKLLQLLNDYYDKYKL
ncbi:MAG: hypothetical protein WBF77_04805 [Sulfurimonadaceae bacterium]